MKKIVSALGCLVVVTLWLSAMPAMANDVKVMYALNLTAKGENCELIPVDVYFEDKVRTTTETLKSMAEKGWKIVVFEGVGKDFATDRQMFRIIFEK